MVLKTQQQHPDLLLLPETKYKDSGTHQDDASADCRGQAEHRHDCRGTQVAQQGLDDPLPNAAHKDVLQTATLLGMALLSERCWPVQGRAPEGVPALVQKPLAAS